VNPGTLHEARAEYIVVEGADLVIPDGEFSRKNSTHAHVVRRRSEETRYEYLKFIGQDLARLWPKGLANLKEKNMQ